MSPPPTRRSDNRKEAAVVCAEWGPQGMRPCICFPLPPPSPFVHRLPLSLFPSLSTGRQGRRKTPLPLSDREREGERRGEGGQSVFCMFAHAAGAPAAVTRAIVSPYYSDSDKCGIVPPRAHAIALSISLSRSPPSVPFPRKNTTLTMCCSCSPAPRPVMPHQNGMFDRYTPCPVLLLLRPSSLAAAAAALVLARSLAPVCVFRV